MRKEQLDNFVSDLNAMRRERLERSLSNTNMKHSEIDWGQRRYEIAKKVFPAIFADKPKLTLQEAAHEAVRYADALIDELRYVDALIDELKKGGEK